MKNAIFILLANIVFTPCLLIFNEQPAGEPQHWWINAIGLAYLGILVYMAKRGTKK